MENSKNIDRKDTRSYKKTVWQEKMKPSGVKARRQHVVGSKEYSVKITLKEVKPKKYRPLKIIKDIR